MVVGGGRNENALLTLIEQHWCMAHTSYHGLASALENRKLCRCRKKHACSAFTFLRVMPSVAAPGGHVIIQLHHSLVVLVGWGISYVGTTTYPMKRMFCQKPVKSFNRGVISM